MEAVPLTPGLLLALASAVSCPVSAYASEYYVSVGGDDGGPGTKAEPFATIQRAATAVVAGDTVHVGPGRYAQYLELDETIVGTPTDPITFVGRVDIDGERAILDGTGLSPPQNALISIMGAQHVVVTGFRLEHAELGAGIKVFDRWAGETIHSQHIVIEDNEIYDTRSSGIGVWNATDVVVRANEIELACNAFDASGLQETLTIASTTSFTVADNDVHDTGGDGSGGGEGIMVKGSSQDGLVYGNRVYASYAEGPFRSGISVNPCCQDHFARDIDVFGNVVFDLPRAHALVVATEGSGGVAEHIRVVNNVAYDNANHGLTIADWGDGRLADITVVNNTVVHNGYADWGGGISVANARAENVLVRNNIVSQNSAYQLKVWATGPGLAIDTNLIDGFTEELGDAHIQGDAGFVDPGQADFHLIERSPAIDAAVPEAAPDDDFDGFARPVGEGFDIGAFEFGATPQGDGDDDDGDGDGDEDGDGGGETGAGGGDENGEGCGCRQGSDRGELFVLALLLLLLPRRRARRAVDFAPQIVNSSA